MKKGLIIPLLLFIFFISSNNVFASDIYFVNDNNVSFSKEEYDFLTKLYWDGCQNLFTTSDYSRFVKSNIMNGELSVKTNEAIMQQMLKFLKSLKFAIRIV